MRPAQIIGRLRAECPVFANRVAGAIDYKRALENEGFPAPHAFVLLAALTADGEEELSGLDQEFTLHYSVVVAVPSGSDSRGQDAGEALMDCFTQIRDALLGWSPEPGLFTPITIEGMTLSDGETAYTRARTFAQIDFTSAAMVRDLT